MPLFIRANRYLSLLLCKGILKSIWKLMVGAINMSCGPQLNRPWHCISPLFSQVLAGSIFFPFPFLWHGLSPQLSTHLQSGSQGLMRSCSCCALAPNGRAEERVNKWPSPAKTKWSLSAELWPPVTKSKEAANRGLTQQNDGLFIHFSVCRMHALYYIPWGERRLGGAMGNRVVKNVLCETHMLELQIWDLDTDFQEENLPRDSQRSLPPV